MIFSTLFYTAFGVFSYEIQDPEGYIDNSVLETIPDGISKDSINEGVSPVIEVLLKNIVPTIKKTLLPIFEIIGTLLFCAISSVFLNSFKTTENNTFLRLLPSAVVIIIVSKNLYKIWGAFTDNCEKLFFMLNSIAASTVSLYALSGSVNSAAVSSMNNSVLITFFAGSLDYMLLPLLQICFSLNVTASICGINALSALSASIRKTYVFLLTVLTAVSGIIISIQNRVASVNDNLMVRGIKMAAGSFIPIVGGFISESVRTVAVSISSLKSSVGYLCLCAVIVFVSPVIVELFIYKLSFAVTGAAADLFGLSHESAFLRSSGELINYMIAFISAAAMIFIIVLMIFAGSVSAVSV